MRSRWHVETPPQRARTHCWKDRINRRRAVYGLEVTGAFAAVVPHAGALRFFVLKGRLTLRAYALRFGVARTANQLDVVNQPITAEMAGDGEVVHRANVVCFHFLH